MAKTKVNLTPEEQKIAALTKQRKANNRKAFFKVLFGRGLIAKFAFTMTCIFILIAIIGPLLTPYTPYEASFIHALEGPSAEHWFGTDQLGRDLATRIIYGCRFSMITGVLSSLWSMIFGCTIGLAAGYFGGVFAQIVMRFCDAMLSIPGLVITMCLAAIFGGSVMSVSFIIAFSHLPSYIRMLYGQVLSLREMDYIVAAKLVGQSNPKILFKHLFPNVCPTIIISFTTGVGGAVMAESGLAYLGIGITPPTPAWGSMVNEGYAYLTTYPHLALAPGFALMLLIISLSITGDGLRDAIDPKLRGKL